MAADPLDIIAGICHEQPHDALTQIAEALGYTEQSEQERAQREQALAGLVKRLARRLHPEDPLRVTATGYLQEQGFFNPLRTRGVVACLKCGGKVADCPYLPQHCPSGVTAPDQRQRFEAWADDQGFPLRRLETSDGYLDLRTHGAWDAWQASAALGVAAGAMDLSAVPGEVLGAPFPDWPEDLTTFAERKAYQRGVAHARAVAGVALPDGGQRG